MQILACRMLWFTKHMHWFTIGPAYCTIVVTFRTHAMVPMHSNVIYSDVRIVCSLFTTSVKLFQTHARLIADDCERGIRRGVGLGDLWSNP